jgi:Na+-translocating ferredoxin:NAD+ oxidoreductase RnfC subunit
MQVAHAVNGKPVTERTVTLTGEFKQPQVVTVAIGTTYNELIRIAGGLTIPDAVLIDGGPMMGKLVAQQEDGIAKTTSGVLALPPDHFLIRRVRQPLGQIIKQAKSACCQCFRCSDLCPRNLIGHAIYPHMTMRTIAYNKAEPTKHITSAFLCSQCGMCELIACDFMQLSPRKIYAAYKQELLNRSIKNPHTNHKLVANSQLPNRKVTIATVMQKLRLQQYKVTLPFTGLQKVNQVRIPLNKHVGIPASPAVNLGQTVRRCDIIAASPADKLGTIYHASIAGKITNINKNYIEIKES